MSVSILNINSPLHLGVDTTDDGISSRIYGPLFFLVAGARARDGLTVSRARPELNARGGPVVDGGSGAVAVVWRRRRGLCCHWLHIVYR